MFKPHGVSLLLAAWLIAAFTVPARAQDLRTLAQSRPPAEPIVTGPQYLPSSMPRTASSKRYGRGVWIATWAAFVAVNLVDAHSSSGRREANPLLRDSNGIFSNRKAAIVKSAAGGGFFALQCWLIHKNPRENYYPAFAAATGAATAALGVVAVHNYGVRKANEPQAAAIAPAYMLRTR